MLVKCDAVIVALLMTISRMIPVCEAAVFQSRAFKYDNGKDLCESLPDFPDGSIKINEFPENKVSIGIYECKAGYSLKGKVGYLSVVRECPWDGSGWKGEQPTCVGPCNYLLHPDNGAVSIDHINMFWQSYPNVEGSTAHYWCNYGYTLKGDKERKCEINSDNVPNWTGTKPTCEGIKCSDPGAPANGARLGNAFSHPAAIYFKCDDGYTLKGSKARLCKGNGKFSGTQPVCQQIINRCIDQCQAADRKLVIIDDCNRQCNCDKNDELVKCTRVRKPWTELSTSEKQRYINAVKTVATDPQYKVEYERLARIYINETVHDTPSTLELLLERPNDFIRMRKRLGMFARNRYFLLEYENLLRRIDCRITIPYWEWTLSPKAPYQHPVWDNTLGFGDSSRELDNCVDSGPFRVHEFKLPEETYAGFEGNSVWEPTVYIRNYFESDPRCVYRRYQSGELSRFPTQEQMDRLLSEHMSSFLSNLDGMASNVQCNVGGLMCSFSSVYDPIYPLHLAFVDFIFDTWQNIQDEMIQSSLYYNDDDDAYDYVMTTFGDKNITMLDIYRNNRLLDGVAVLYDVSNASIQHPSM